MLTNYEKKVRLQDAIALLNDVDAMQQVVFGTDDISLDNHMTILELIGCLEDELETIGA